MALNRPQVVCGHLNRPDQAGLEFSKSLSSLKETEKYSDLTIKCRDREWKVHKAIVCLASSVLAKMCDSKFKEGVTSVIDASGDNPEIMEKLIKCMYQFDYDDTYDESTFDHNQTPSELLVIASVYVLADQYDVEAVKVTSVEKMSYLVNGWIDIDFECSNRAFIDVARFIWNNTITAHEDIRKSFLKVLRSFQSSLLLSSDEFIELFRENTDFAMDYCLYNLENSRAHKGWNSRPKLVAKCRKCNNSYTSEDVPFTACLSCCNSCISWGPEAGLIARRDASWD